MPSPSRTRSRAARTVGQLADVVHGRVVHGDPSTRVADLTHDSRVVPLGAVYAARPGARADGHDFVDQAVARGAVAVLAQRPVAVAVPQVVVDDVAVVLGEAAAAVHDHPSEALALLGVTGTNGKTTTAFLLEAGLRSAGRTTGLIGTVETRVADEVVAGVRTTPEATDLQRLLGRMRRTGVDAAAMEVSSHGLALGRVSGTRFAAVGFTNLSHDHLDFHGTIERYRAAKASLLTARYAPVAVIDVDDPTGREIATRTDVPVVGVTTDVTEPRRAPDGVARMLRVVSADMRPAGSHVVVDLDGRRADLHVRLPGPFNVANAALAVAMLAAAGIDLDTAARGLSSLDAVPGRMQRVDVGQPFGVVVDYAHTPDALARVLAAARQVTAGRVIVVIGAGGDRDPSKRPAMGRAAALGADVAVLTSDNPRSEDPEAILDAVAAGAADAAGARVVRDADRRAAIARALALADADDLVVVAGKGHERTQELADRVVAFDDRAVVRELLAPTYGTPDDPTTDPVAASGAA